MIAMPNEAAVPCRPIPVHHQLTNSPQPGANRPQLPQARGRWQWQGSPCAAAAAAPSRLLHLQKSSLPPNKARLPPFVALLLGLLLALLLGLLGLLLLLLGLQLLLGLLLLLGLPPRLLRLLQRLLRPCGRVSCSGTPPAPPASTLPPRCTCLWPHASRNPGAPRCPRRAQCHAPSCGGGGVREGGKEGEGGLVHHVIKHSSSAS